MFEPTGRAGRPLEKCESCRKKRYASEVCHNCGERLPEERNRHRVYCNKRCQNTAWRRADRAARRLTKAR